MPDFPSTPTPTLSDPVAARIATAFGLGRVLSCRRIAQGLMNPNWKLTTEAGSYAIKQLQDRPPETVRDNHRVLPKLAEQGLPVPLPCTTGHGDTLLRVGDDWYTASAWLPGTHLNGHNLTPSACAALGELTGRLHNALAAALPGAPNRLLDSPTTVDEAQARLERFARATAGGSGEDFDELAHAEIRQRQALLHRIACQQPPPREVEPAGWTHGDLQPLNLLIDPFTGRVTAILDWDRLDVRGYGAEVVRTATIWFTHASTGALDLDRVAAFIRGYRTQRPISDAQLLDAAHRRWWQLATGTWQLRLHYDQHDQGCDHLFFSDGRLLRWWLARTDAVNAALTAPTEPE